MSRIRSLLWLICLTIASHPGFSQDGPSNAIEIDSALLAGKWRITDLQINGNAVTKSDAEKLSVSKQKNGTWSVLSQGKSIATGTSTLQPLANPKTIDFSFTGPDGKTQQFEGIYQLGERQRKLCFASSEYGRPTEFVSLPGGQQILVTFQRIPAPETLPTGSEGWHSRCAAPSSRRILDRRVRS